MRLAREETLLSEFTDDRLRGEALGRGARYGNLINALLGAVTDPERMRYLVICAAAATSPDCRHHLGPIIANERQRQITETWLKKFEEAIAAHNRGQPVTRRTPEDLYRDGRCASKRSGRTAPAAARLPQARRRA